MCYVKNHYGFSRKPLFLWVYLVNSPLTEGDKIDLAAYIYFLFWRLRPIELKFLTLLFLIVGQLHVRNKERYTSSNVVLRHPEHKSTAHLGKNRSFEMFRYVRLSLLYMYIINTHSLYHMNHRSLKFYHWNDLRYSKCNTSTVRIGPMPSPPRTE
jgi:hypothetical protein